MCFVDCWIWFPSVLFFVVRCFCLVCFDFAGLSHKFVCFQLVCCYFSSLFGVSQRSSRFVAFVRRFGAVRVAVLHHAAVRWLDRDRCLGPLLLVRVAPSAGHGRQQQHQAQGGQRAGRERLPRQRLVRRNRRCVSCSVFFCVVLLALLSCIIRPKLLFSIL